MTVAKERPLIMAKETYRKLLTDPKLQAELLIRLFANSRENGVMEPIRSFEYALAAVEERYRELLAYELKEGEE